MLALSKLSQRGVDCKMRVYMDENFLLETKTAETLYHDYAAELPIIDYHTHFNPAQIMKNAQFENITHAWLHGDHYKWRLMRIMGVEERYITGDATDWEKFQKFAEILPKCIGNPVHHWAHMELQRYFDCNLVVNAENAQEIWDATEEMLKQDSLRARPILKKMNVKMIGTTDDVTSDLQWHKALKEDKTNSVIVTPTFRPDKIVNIEMEGFAKQVEDLAKQSGKSIDSVDTLKAALLERIQFFDEMGCKASDHGMEYLVFRKAEAKTVEEVFQKGLSGVTLSEEEIEIFKTDLMLFFGKEFAKRRWVMQLHYCAMRNINQRMFRLLGPGSGYDTINPRECARALAEFLSALEEEQALPRTIVFSLNPNDNPIIDSIVGSFQEGGVVGKVQHGMAWWYNDAKVGIENHLLSFAELGALGSFIGMLTDSVSFFSFPRHEYFRRILCNVIGKMVECGEYPNDIKALGEIVQDISCHNAARYFGIDLL